MKIQYFVASMTFAAVLVAPTAYSAPGGGAVVTHFLTKHVFAYGNYSDGNIDNGFYSEVYDDLTGVSQGYVSSYSWDLNTGNYSSIECSGPAYAKAVSVTGNGSSTINATLDPNSPDCYYSYNVFSPITVTADGQFDGYYANLTNGNGKATWNGATSTYNTKGDIWSQTFSADNGFYSGTFTGYASIEQYTNRQKVK